MIWDFGQDTALISCFIVQIQTAMSHSMTKTNKITSAPSEDSDEPGHVPGLIKSLLCAQWVPKDLKFSHADSKDSDQTGRMPRLI